MSLHLLCLLLHCSHPAPAVPNVIPPALPIIEEVDQPTEPTDDEPDGHFPLRWIFRYDENGNMPDPWYWRNDTNPGYLPLLRS